MAVLVGKDNLRGDVLALCIFVRAFVSDAEEWSGDSGDEFADHSKRRSF